MMAVRLAWGVVAMMLVGCSGGGAEIGAGVPTGDNKSDPTLSPVDAGDASSEDAGGQADGAESTDAGDAGSTSDGAATVDAATLPDANASKPAGNTLSNATDAGAPWSDGDPAKLYPYVTAYRYADTGDYEVEFSSTPATAATGNRIVVSCWLTGMLCHSYSYRTERSCNHSTTGGNLVAQFTINADKTVSGHFEPLKFAQGTLAGDAVNLPVVTVAKHACADGLP